MNTNKIQKELSFPIILTEDKMNELIKDITSSLVYVCLGDNTLEPSKEFPDAMQYTKEAQDMLEQYQLEWRNSLAEFFDLPQVIKPITYPKK